MPRAFHPFTPEHYAALAIGLVFLVLFIAAGRRRGKVEKSATLLLAIVNFSVYPLSVIGWLSVDGPKSIDNFVPFHLCDIAAITAGLALLTRKPMLCALTYFWGLAATIQGLVTPAVTVEFPELPFVVFFIHHFAVVIAALYLPVVQGWRPFAPLWKTPLVVFAWSVLYQGITLVVNKALGSNFAFSLRPPDNPSLIDHLGPWPWYLFAMQGVALVFFFLLVLPFAGRTRER